MDEQLEGRAQAIAHIQDTSLYAAVKPLIPAGDASGRIYLFDYDAKGYEEIARFVKQEGSVSTVESLAELVAEYAKRTADRKTGQLMTVTFTAAGASFSLDDNDRRHNFTYRRVLSQQWEALKATLGRAMSHKDLVRTLQTLSPSIVDYTLVITAFRRIVISKDIKLASEPTLNEGGSDNFYQVKLNVKGGTTETTLPSSIAVKLQYARGGSAFYEIPVEVDLSDDEGVPVITLFAPTLPAVANQAVVDEMKLFDEQMDASGLTDLLCVVNF